MLPLQDEEVSSPRNPRRHHATGRVLHRCGVGVGVLGTGTLIHIGFSMPEIACTACYTNIVQLGFSLIAWWLGRPSW